MTTMIVWAGGAGRPAAWPAAVVPPGDALARPGPPVADATGPRGDGDGVAGTAEPHAARVRTPARAARSRSLIRVTRSPHAPRWPGGPCGRAASPAVQRIMAPAPAEPRRCCDQPVQRRVVAAAQSPRSMPCLLPPAYCILRTVFLLTAPAMPGGLMEPARVGGLNPQAAHSRQTGWPFRSPAS